MRLQIDLLRDCYVAAVPHDPMQPEWPPHPARVYAALTEALHVDDEPDPNEVASLRWLESQPPPVVWASKGCARTSPDLFVSANQRPKAAGLGLLPELRPRLPRPARPVFVPHVPRVVLQWAETPPAELAEALDELCSRVARIGHSSSMASMRLDDEADTEDLTAHRPASHGEHTLRVVETGQLDRLEAMHEHAQPSRVMPATPQRYTTADPDTPPAQSVWAGGDLVRWRVVAPSSHGARTLLGLRAAEAVSRELRRAILRGASGKPPTLLSGHDPDGSPTRRLHAAFWPLPDVGHRWASGSVIGMAMQLPRAADWSEIDQLAEALRRAERDGRLTLAVGRAGVVHLERIEAGHTERRLALDPDTWSEASTTWATVTPIALDRNPGPLQSPDEGRRRHALAKAQQSVSAACEAIGLPRPTRIRIVRSAPFVGTPLAHQFMPFPRGRRMRRVCVHARLTFDRVVRGPVLLGAGRYVGVGVLRPLRAGGDA